jgi:hypothetical protein
MHKRYGAALAAAIMAGSLAAVTAEAGNGDKATGGGQILFATKGAGNTIAFTAQGTAEAAKGQIQFIDRSGGNGGDQVKYHGSVSCIDVTGNVAKVAGTLTNGESFNLYVEDNGEGGGATDAIFFDSMADTPDCGFDEPSDDDIEALARGNAQVRDGGAKQTSSRKRATALTYTKALSLAGLR